MNCFPTFFPVFVFSAKLGACGNFLVEVKRTSVTFSSLWNELVCFRAMSLVTQRVSGDKSELSVLGWVNRSQSSVNAAFLTWILPREQFFPAETKSKAKLLKKKKLVWERTIIRTPDIILCPWFCTSIPIYRSTCMQIKSTLLHAWLNCDWIIAFCLIVTIHWFPIQFYFHCTYLHPLYVLPWNIFPIYTDSLKVLF